MTEYVLDSGEVLTDEDIERECAEYEDGTWEGGTHDYHIGRPPLTDEELETVTFRAPKSKVAAMERKAKERGISKSEFLRQAMEKAIA